MKVVSIAECSLGAFCNTFDLHYVLVGLEKTTHFFLSGLLRQVFFYTIKFNGYPIWEVKNNNFLADWPIPVKQGRVRETKIFLRLASTTILYLWSSCWLSWPVCICLVRRDHGTPTFEPKIVVSWPVCTEFCRKTQVSLNLDQERLKRWYM